MSMFLHIQEGIEECFILQSVTIKNIFALEKENWLRSIWIVKAINSG